MKLNKIIIATSLLLSGAFVANAQEEVTENVYTPNWYIQGQFGGQETLGETPFNKLLAPTAQLAVGHNFNPYVGLRLAFNGWQSKAGTELPAHTYRWDWNYVSGNLDVTFNLTNIFGGFKPSRVVDVNIFGGIGANVGWNNKEAARQADLYKTNHAYALSNSYVGLLQDYLWDGTKARFMGNFGADIWFNLSQHVALGIEANANMLPDQYNSKKAGNIDWYFNAMAGIKYTFGKKYKKVTRVIEPTPCNCEPSVVERVIERVIETPAPAPAPVEVKAEPLRRDIFFTISNTVISNAERYKVDEVANYLKAHPKAVVSIMGYADKGTGSKAINLRLSKQRADAVYNALVNEYGVAKNRIRVESMDENMEQPYSTPQENRVAICVAEER